MRDSDSAEGGAKREADARCGPASCAQIAMPEVDTLKISNDDAAFILGKNGKTKEKIARVSGADLDLFEHSLTLEIRGTDEERRRAKKYEGCARDTRAHPWPRHIRPPSFASAAARLVGRRLSGPSRLPSPSSRRYVECVMAQRVGPVHIEETQEDDDLTVIQVPTEAVGFVTGSQGNFLRQVEEEWGTLMFFADFRGRGSGREVSALG